MMVAPVVYNQDESPLIICCQTDDGSIFHNYTVSLGDSDASGINGQEIIVTESSCSRTDFSSSTLSTQTDSSSTILSRSTISCDSSLGSRTKISAAIPSVQLYVHTLLQTWCQESTAQAGETKLRPLPRPPSKKKSLPLQECSRINKLYELSKLKQNEGKKRREQIALERAKNIEKKKLDITRLRNETTAASLTKPSTTSSKLQPKVSSSLKTVEGCPRASRLYGLSKSKQNDGKKRREEIALASNKKNALPENDGKKISLSKAEEMYHRGIKALRDKEIRMAELKERQERAKYEFNSAKDSIAD